MLEEVKVIEDETRWAEMPTERVPSCLVFPTNQVTPQSHRAGSHRGGKTLDPQH